MSTPAEILVGDPPKAAARAGNRFLSGDFLPAALVVLAVQGLLLATSQRGVWHGDLIDGDCYMHLQRALRLMLGANWHHLSDPRINAPYGFTIHWTSLFDMLLAAGATPLRLFGLAPADALYLWGAAISPCLLLAALPVFALGVRPWVRGLAFAWLTVLIFTQPQLSGAFLIGRADHHSLILGLLLAQLAVAYAIADGRAGPATALAGGLLGGLGSIASLEGFIVTGILSAALALVWVFLNPGLLKRLLMFLAANLGTMVLWLLWEGALGRTPVYDRLSIVHVTVLATAMATLAVPALLQTRLARWPARLGALILAGAATAAVTALVFPDFFLGPWPHIAPSVRHWHAGIAEIQPLVPHDLASTALFLSQLGAPLLSLPFIVRQLYRGEGALRAAMLISLVGFLGFGVLALAQMRWSAEVQAMTILPWTLTTLAIMRSTWSIRIGRHAVPLRSAMLSAALLLEIIPGALSSHPQTGAAASPAPACDWHQATRALTRLAPADGIMLTELWYGPEILWRTGLRVVGAPYEMAPAMQDSFAVLEGREPQARQVIHRRGVNFILACGETSGFGATLARGEAPSWLAPQPFAVSGFHLYRVQPGS